MRPPAALRWGRTWEAGPA